VRRDRKMHASPLREFALGLPGAYEEFPWGESVAKVGRKVFVYLGRSDEEKANASPKKQQHVGEPGSVSISVKLPESGKAVLRRPYARPTDYGLGAHGWVTVYFEAGDEMPHKELRAWIEESYRAVASKKLVTELEGRRRHRGMP
jgi:predicted DNA-binding protein (MmcQ/YjbR family)